MVGSSSTLAGPALLPRGRVSDRPFFPIIRRWPTLLSITKLNQLTKTKRDFFILLIKVFGLFSAVTSIFYVLPRTIGYLSDEINIAAVVTAVGSLMIAVGLFLLLIFQSGRVVDLLGLHKGFDNDYIELGNFKPRDILRIGTFIIGGFMLIENIPDFYSHCLNWFKEESTGFMHLEVDKFNWLVSTIKLFVGYILVTNYEAIANKLHPSKETEE